MKPALYEEVALNQDFPVLSLQKGDVATLIDYVPHPQQGEEGAIIEVFNALGDSTCVVIVPVSSIDAIKLRSDALWSCKNAIEACYNVMFVSDNATELR